MRVRAEVDAAVEIAAVGLGPEAVLEGDGDGDGDGDGGIVCAECALPSPSFSRKEEWVQSGT